MMAQMREVFAQLYREDADFSFDRRRLFYLLGFLRPLPEGNVADKSQERPPSIN